MFSPRFVLDRGLKDRGILVTTLPNFALIARSVWQKMFGSGEIKLGNLRDHPEDYAELERPLAQGLVKPVVDRIAALAEAAQSYKTFEAGGTVGKVVLRIA